MRLAIVDSLCEIATPKQYLEFKQELSTLRSHLPVSPHIDVPRPQSPFTGTDDHSDEVLQVLTASYAEAKFAMEVCDEALAVYERLSISQEHLLKIQEQLGQLESSLTVAVDKLRPMPGRPCGTILDDEDALSLGVSHWFESLPQTVRQINDLHAPIVSVVQTAAIASIKHRNLLAEATNIVKSENGVFINEGYVGTVEKTSDRLLAVSRNALESMKDMQEMAQLLDLAQRIHGSANSIEPGITQLLSRAKYALRDPLTGEIIHLERDLREMEIAAVDQLETPMSELEGRLASRRIRPTICRMLDNRTTSCRADITEIEQLLTLANCIRMQESTVTQIEAEANNFLRRLDNLKREADRMSDSSFATEGPLALENLQSRASHVTVENREWNSLLWKRIIWTSSIQQSRSSGASRVEPNAAQTAHDPAISFSVPPLTPPASPHLRRSPSFSNIESTQALDDSARLRVNQATARVNASVSILSTAIESIPWQRWRTKMDDDIDCFNRYEREALSCCDDIKNRLLAIRNGSNPELIDVQQMQTARRECERLQSLVNAQLVSASSMGEIMTDMMNQIRRCPTIRPTEQFEQFRWMAEDATGRDQELTAALRRLSDDVQVTTMAIRQKLDQWRGDAAKATNDVFGPLSTESSASEITGMNLYSPSLSALRKRLDALQLDSILRPHAAASAGFPDVHPLPTSPIARRIKDELDGIQKALVGIKDKAEATDGEWTELYDRVEASLTESPLLNKLVDVGSASRQCDDVFSNLIEALDETAMSVESIELVRDEAMLRVAHLENTALGLKDDSRVSLVVKQALTTWEELGSLTEAAIHPSRAPSVVDFDDDLSEAGSTRTSLVGLTSSKNGSLVDLATPKSRRLSSRATSNPLTNPASYMSATKSSQARSASDSMQPPISLSRIPRMRYDSMRSTTSSTRLSMSSTSPSSSSLDLRSLSSIRTIAGPSKMPMKDSGAAEKTLRPMRSRLSSSTRVPVKKRYVPDPKSKLDLAVGRVVNKLNVSCLSTRLIGIDYGDR